MDHLDGADEASFFDFYFAPSKVMEGGWEFVDAELQADFVDLVQNLGCPCITRLDVRTACTCGMEVHVVGLVAVAHMAALHYFFLSCCAGAPWTTSSCVNHSRFGAQQQARGHKEAAAGTQDFGCQPLRPEPHGTRQSQIHQTVGQNPQNVQDVGGGG